MKLDELLLAAQRIELKSRQLARSHYAGLYRSAFKGQGMEFSDVREYRDGDDVRLIDWNVSARSQGLYVKKMVEEREQNVLLIIDTSRSLRFGSVRRTKFDLLLEVASLFILAGFYARDRVSLAFFADRVESFIPPAKGWNHAARLIREIVVRAPSGNPPDMDPLWNFLSSPGVRRSLVILFTDFKAPLSSSDSFSTASRKHEIIAVLATDPREWEIPSVGRIRLIDPESGRTQSVNTNLPSVREGYRQSAEIMRGRYLRILDSNGVDWLELSTASDYEISLRRFLASRAVKRGYRRL